MGKCFQLLPQLLPQPINSHHLLQMSMMDTELVPVNFQLVSNKSEENANKRR